ncbi:DnaJ-class molecular chaperone [Bradyrhizobium sp. LA6.3]
MTPIVEHKNGNRRSVRDELAMEYVACVPCKGNGTVYRYEGGNLWALGWVVHRECFCGHCRGQGILRLPADVSAVGDSK